MAKRIKPWYAYRQAWYFILFGGCVALAVALHFAGGMTNEIAVPLSIVVAALVAFAIHVNSQEAKHREHANEAIVALGAFHKRYSNALNDLPRLMGATVPQLALQHEFNPLIDKTIATLQEMPIEVFRRYDPDIASAINTGCSALQHARDAFNAQQPDSAAIAYREVSKAMGALVPHRQAFENADPWVATMRNGKGRS